VALNGAAVISGPVEADFFRDHPNIAYFFQSYPEPTINLGLALRG
jgi:hypothetical protein